MTISRLKRIELITTIIVTILLIPYALVVGWLMSAHYSVEFWQIKSIRYISFIAPLIYGLLALTLTPIILLVIRRITQKNIAALTVFLTTLPSAILLFGAPLIYLPIVIIWFYLAEASQGGVGWPLGVHVGLSIVIGFILSLILSLLLRVYVNFRNQIVTQSNEAKSKNN